MGYLAPREANWLTKSGVTSLDGWRTASANVKMTTIRVGQDDIGVLFLPMLPAGQEKAPRYMVRSILDKAAKLRERTKLVVAVSPWGYTGELAFLTENPPAVDIMLGAGPGPGLAGRFEAEAKTFWVRAYSKGRAVHILRINEWPDRARKDWHWEREANLVLDFRPLRETVDADADMAQFVREHFPDAR
ncbi:hypothetical protein GGQ74_000372 [Desulfobaculum xiamenense]|uniref:Uncharacterized protein n=2 Tax=Desulfobaculum xiamenense TaxID=995050 RepID=A0A846QJS8_9BACT|nr:hypothetical protein [Desulfobaculum xiamenense]NJB66732.1 hypothetical protein [Desulfobaculum xiamenense]